MNTGAIVSRAWQIAWQHKSLWLVVVLPGLILLVVAFVLLILFSGLAGVGISQLGTRNSDFGSALGGGAVLSLVCLYFAFIVAAVVVAVITQGGLIAGVNQVETTGSTSFSQAWSAGAARFWPLLGLIVLMVIAYSAIALLSTGFSFATTLGSLGTTLATGDEGARSGLGALFAGLGLLQCALQCVAFIVLLALVAIETLGAQAIVVDRAGVFESISRAWQMIRSNLGSVIALALTLFVISLAIVFVFGILLFVLILLSGGMAALTGSSRDTAGAGLAGVGILLACGLPILGVIYFLANIVLQVFSSATWTLAYREFTGQSGQAGMISPPTSTAPLPPASSS